MNLETRVIQQNICQKKKIFFTFFRPFFGIFSNLHCTQAIKLAV